MLSFNSYIWRGQRDAAWQLLPTLYRLLKAEGLDRYAATLARDAQLKEFKLAARGRRGQNPPALATEDEWWALGQHHGLATPLLDWTTSPFVAAFFAFSETSAPTGGQRAVFALHAPSLERWATQKADEEKARRRQRQRDIKEGRVQLGLLEHAGLRLPDPLPELRLITPLMDENARLVSQGGQFTFLDSLVPLEEWIATHHPEDDEAHVLAKILLPDSLRDECLASLNRMNINYSSLFPDLTGASLHCNLARSVKSY